jgi:hypothetical protein
VSRALGPGGEVVRRAFAARARIVRRLLVLWTIGHARVVAPMRERRAYD